MIGGLEMKADPSPFSLLTDLYELTMAAAYYRNNMFAPATFSLFIRDYPPDRGYLVSAGIADVVDFLESLRFSPEDLTFLQKQGLFKTEFIDFLSGFRFTGDVAAVPEGRIFFKDEPLLEVTAPIIEAQLAETFIINAVNLQVSITTKASRCVHAAAGRNLVDFSLRRTQGTDAGIKVARSCYIAGFSATSNVLAGKCYDIPISGTMAHSYVTSFTEEIEAFRSFAETFPENTVLLIDTYDTLSGAQNAVEVAKEMAARGNLLRGVRLDSGDMTDLSRKVRTILDDADFRDVRIFASGGFDEYKIKDAVDRGARIDAFGVGTKMGVSADGPYTDMAYKLVRYNGRPVLKLSSGKKTLVERKQVFRKVKDGDFHRDVIALREEHLAGEPLLVPAMEQGRRTTDPEPLSVIRGRFIKEFSVLDDRYKSIKSPSTYPVELSDGLKQRQSEAVHTVRYRELGES
jgi:nicotinate phosphoribosyltransferase